MAKVRIVVLLEQEMLEELEELAGCMSDVSRGALVRELLAEALAVRWPHHAERHGVPAGSSETELRGETQLVAWGGSPPEPSSPAELPDQPEIPVSEPEALSQVRPI